MGLTRSDTLLLALLMASPALWQALVTGSLDLTDGLLRFLIAVPVSAVMLAMLRGLARAYHHRPENVPAGHPPPGLPGPVPEPQPTPPNH